MQKHLVQIPFTQFLTIETAFEDALSFLLYNKHQIRVFPQFNTLLLQYHTCIPFKSYTYINNKSFSFLLSSGILFSKSFVHKQRELITKLYINNQIFLASTTAHQSCYLHMLLFCKHTDIISKEVGKLNDVKMILKIKWKN